VFGDPAEQRSLPGTESAMSVPGGTGKSNEQEIAMTESLPAYDLWNGHAAAELDVVA
jgi:hypothetical protein